MILSSAAFFYYTLNAQVLGSFCALPNHSSHMLTAYLFAVPVLLFADHIAALASYVM